MSLLLFLFWTQERLKEISKEASVEVFNENQREIDQKVNTAIAEVLKHFTIISEYTLDYWS